MNTISINDMALSKDLDRKAMGALSGGGSALLYTGTSYSSLNTTFSHSSSQLVGYGWYNGNWAAMYSYKKHYKQTRMKTKSYQKIVWG